jgi:thiol-disulfide isomerase/thioredoxin
MNDNVMKFSAFDGAHAFLFTATVSDSTLQGVFYSGNHSRETFIAKLNETYDLPSEDGLTFLKEGYDTLAFSFPDAKGNVVSLDDTQFKDKVVIVQIMGTWCPNCLDETRYYKTFYDANKEKDIAFVALAFEYAKTKEKAFAGIQRLKDRVGIDYPILLAQFGSSDKGKSQEKLPMLNHVLSYPTTVFIDKKGKVRKIHTGFNGPATGEKYVSFQKEFTVFIEELLVE